MNIIIPLIPFILMAVIMVFVASRKPTNPPNYNDHLADIPEREWESDDLTYYFEDIGIRFKSQ